MKLLNRAERDIFPQKDVAGKTWRASLSSNVIKDECGLELTEMVYHAERPTYPNGREKTFGLGRITRASGIHRKLQERLEKSSVHQQLLTIQNLFV